ncbi:MAG: nucleoside hydrolase [Pseudoxanthomonas sp.]
MSEPHHPTSGKRLVILEDDIDGFTPAQLLLLQSPEVEVLGISAVSGNIWRDEALAHTCRLLELAGRPDIPVLPGPVQPLLNSEAATERWEALHGRLVWKGAWTRQWVEADTVQSAPRYHAHDVVPDLALGNPSVVKPSDEHAALFMLRMVRQYPGQVSIVATGPLTNLALAQSLDPAFAALAKELVYMGGSLNPRRRLDSVSAAQFAREFVNSPRREFNIRWDPEAARIVQRAPWRKITMVPIDPSTATELTPALLARIGAADTTMGRALRRREPGFPMWDEIAAAVWLRPELATVAETLYVDTDTDPGAGYGDTLSWAPSYPPGLGEQAQTVVLEVDVAALETLLVERLTAAHPPSVGAPLP